MKKLVIFLSILILVACTSPSQDLLDEQEIVEAIAGTLTAMPHQPTEDKIQSTMMVVQTEISQATEEAMPTDAPPPTDKPEPTPTTSFEDAQKELVRTFIGFLEGHNDISAVNLVRIEPGFLKIEVRTDMLAEGNQPDVSYVLIQDFSIILGDSPPEKLYALVDSDSFAINLITYSDTGQYRYESFTDFETIQMIFNRSISYEEWASVANAGFR